MALVSPVSDLIGMCVTLVRAFLAARNDNPHSALDESLRGLTPSSAAIEEKHTSGHVNTYDPTPAVSRTYAFHNRAMANAAQCLANIQFDRLTLPKLKNAPLEAQRICWAIFSPSMMHKQLPKIESDISHLVCDMSLSILVHEIPV